MLKVAKRLSRPNFDRLNYVFFRFVTLGPGFKSVEADCEDELREEILQAPRVSYHSRFMLDSADEAYQRGWQLRTTRRLIAGGTQLYEGTGMHQQQSTE
ncbi:hypothetical protein LTS15_007523 [Exophiala xenobiotica]|nr:hypothetical protein LTS15_007523 [Exophiala xenobiotica]